MKTALIFFKHPFKSLDAEYINQAVEVFLSSGFSVDRTEILSDSDDLGFKRRIDEIKDTFDNLVIADDGKVTFSIKKIVAESFNSVLIENDNAKTFLDAVSKATNEDGAEDYAVIPDVATLIPNVNGVYQGYMIDDKEFLLSVVPADIHQYSTMCGKYIVPYLENKYSVKSKRLKLKYIGDRLELDKAVKKAKEISGVEFNVYITEKYGDTTIDLVFNGERAVAESGHAVRAIVGELKDDIYAEFDTTPSERLFDLLKLRRYKLSTAESFTAGRIVSSVIANAGASEFVEEGVVCYSNNSKQDRVGVIKDDLSRHGAISSIVAYEMAAGLLVKGNCDIAIATTGLAGPNGEGNKPVGLCYIAVGMKNGVHTYKYNFSGTREEITETAKNYALALAIKKLKNV